MNIFEWEHIWMYLIALRLFCDLVANGIACLELCAKYCLELMGIDTYCSE